MPALADVAARIGMEAGEHIMDRLAGLQRYRSLPPTEQRAIAVHEAAHVVAALALESRFEMVNLVPASSEGMLAYVRRAGGKTAVTTSDRVRELWVLLAGGAGEEIFTGQRCPASESSDLRTRTGWLPSPPRAQ